MKRARYLELAKVADDICLLLMERKVKPSEGCLVRQIAECQWNSMRATYDEIRGGLSNAACQPTEHIEPGQDMLSEEVVNGS